MKKLFAVTLIKGAGWDASKLMRSQAHWTEHAALMDQFVTDGFIILGGPVGDNEDKALLVINAKDENEIYSAFADDPWILRQIREFGEIQRWTILLEGEKAK
jgi:uncharacterized protein YciI